MFLRVVLLVAIFFCAGCVSTQNMPDGSVRVKLFDRRLVNQYLANQVLPSQAGQQVQGMDEPGVISLLATKDPFSDNLLYLDGRFPIQCLSEFMYMAKSGSDSLKKNTEYKGCRYAYMKLQYNKRKAGMPYDMAAPSLFDATEAEINAYWEHVVSEAIAYLNTSNKYRIRFYKLTNAKGNGLVTISPKLGDPGGDINALLACVPSEVPITVDDPVIMAKMQRQTETIGCDAIWEYQKSFEKTATNSLSTRYMVVFKTTKIKCYKPKRKIINGQILTFY